jgi:hypothetical protein
MVKEWQKKMKEEIGWVWRIEFWTMGRTQLFANT